MDKVLSGFFISWLFDGYLIKIFLFFSLKKIQYIKKYISLYCNY